MRGSRERGSTHGRGKTRPWMPGIFIVMAAWISGAALPDAAAEKAGATTEILSPARLSGKTEAGREYRIPVRLNDNHDNGRFYTARRFWRCADNCPDENLCDHRSHEPVWDHLYVGGPVDGENDLVAITLTAAGPAPEGVILDILSGADSIRLWPSPTKGHKRDIVANGTRFHENELPKTLHVEGVKSGTALLRLRSPDGNGEGFLLHVDVVALVESQAGRRKFIYDPGRISLALEPAEALASPAYRKRIVWDGEASGTKPKIRIAVDPGEDADNRRVVYQVRATIDGRLVFERNIRVRQKVFTGSPVATTTAERRREVESLLEVPSTLVLKDTELPDTPSRPFSQTWFEARYTGSSRHNDPVPTINQSRLQYAPLKGKEDHAWGVACCYLNPYGVFITRLAYEDGLKLEDLQAVAHHELRHLSHYSTMDAATGFWHVLCRHLDHRIATDFMEADASSASLHSNGSWRYLHKTGHDMVRRYRASLDAIPGLPSLAQIESAVTVLQDIYTGIPDDMDAFKRSGYECHIRPPLEIDEMGM